ncbi:MAG: four helix bundle protein [Candidatus Peregrinibacteria bacterium]
MDIGFRRLIIWQEAKKLALKIYGVTKAFPKEEQFHLVTQIRRAATSIMANIAEGSAMQTRAHRDAFYGRARGSVAEVDAFIELSSDLDLISKADANDIADHCARLSYLLTQLLKSK